MLGGGPAGATFAALAASAGARVVLLERESFPREKVCGEFVSTEGIAVLSRLGIFGELQAAGATAIDACRITDPAGRSAQSKFPECVGGQRGAAGLSRALLDHSLLQLATRRGVDVRDRTESTVPLFSAGRVIGVRSRRVGSRVYGEATMATVVVAADGRKSSLVRALHPQRGDPSKTSGRSWFGLQIHIDGARLAEGGRVELCLFPGGYAGLSEIEGGRVNLCMLATVAALKSCGGSPHRLVLERVMTNPVAREILEGIELAGPFRSIGPLQFGRRRATAAGALFLGDAAGTVDPFCGEGISLALRSAELALPAALEGVAGGGLEPSAARGYDRVWRRLFSPVARRSSVLGWILNRPKAASATLSLLALRNGALFSKVVAATRSGSRFSPPD